VRWSNGWGAGRTLKGYDWIVIALGARPRDALSAAARARGTPVWTVGEARAPGQAVAAIADGLEAGRSLE
jgi:hypothetical protein